jgi:hypothetical protein
MRLRSVCGPKLWGDHLVDSARISCCHVDQAVSDVTPGSSLRPILGGLCASLGRPNVLPRHQHVGLTGEAKTGGLIAVSISGVKKNVVLTPF